MAKHIKTNRLNRITKTSKSCPNIKVSHDATDNQPKPYIGSRRGRGMPSAREPWESPSEKARENMDRIFGHGDDKVQNAKVTAVCDRKDCGAYSVRKSSGCVLFPFDVFKCTIKNNKAIYLK